MAKTKQADRLQTISIELDGEDVAGQGKATAFPTSISTAERIGIEIFRAEYLVEIATLTALMLAAADTMMFGLTQIEANIPDNNNPHLAGVIDHKELVLMAAPTGPMVQFPLVTEFPEPILVHPASLYGWQRGENLGGVMGAVHVKIWFKYVDLAEKDYTDILQTIIMQNVI
jgi:hypothetical protein